MHRQIFAAVCLLSFAGQLAAETPRELRLGRAGHAFDHLGEIGGQAEAAFASGATIIYAGGLGEAGYHGLPPQKEFDALREKVSAYNRGAKANGIQLAIGYLCATSIIKLDTFDNNWTDDFRAQFKTRPAEWRQQDRHGKPLASWYGGDYQPACMNNPDWRAYERAMVRYSLETGHDGVFFDNPTVHPQGCYCPHCMKAFSAFLQSSPLAPREEIFSRSEKTTDRMESLRKLAETHPKEFMRFRSTIARDFLADMRAYARKINPQALITCNNSLNAPSVMYSQCRTYGYNIQEMSKAEDYVVVEDMNTQPRTEAIGQALEYGPTYKQLHAISHGKPIVAVTVANADYHTAPNLMRLAMAEAVAHNASYLSWPTWPENQRKRMIAAVRPQADFLRRNDELLNDSPFRADVLLFLPFRRWIDTEQCAASNLAAALTKANVQYKVICEDDFTLSPTNGRLPVLLVESRGVLTKTEQRALATFEKGGGHVVAADQADWLHAVGKAVGQPSLVLQGPPTVRAVVHDQASRAIVHLYNLNIQRLSSFDDKVTPAANVKVTVAVPFANVRRVNVDSADDQSTRSAVDFTTNQSADQHLVTFTIPSLAIQAMAVIEP